MSQMTRRGGKEASEGRSGIEEDERQPVMARLATRWRRSNLMKLVTLKKRKPSVCSISEKGLKKRFIQNKEGFLRGPQGEAEIQCKALRRGKNLTFSEDTCLEKKECGRR